ncbi:zinc finger protein 35-like [Nilaparvata lugens]|uniref:zinc finger protein 35-like n=1 Tax=Nilaparvata lugens TaxID=108931 RepID=UPI00193E4574|nr:zinc finger protein 35-like [Nilaparvata lugens]
MKPHKKKFSGERGKSGERGAMQLAHYGQSTDLESGSKKYKCETCSKSFLEHYNLLVHQRSTLENGLMYALFVAKKSGITKTTLSTSGHMHRKQRSLAKFAIKPTEENVTLKDTYTRTVKKAGMMEEHQCHICGKTSETSVDLETHLRHHIPRVKSVSCSQCQRMFTSDGTLKIHMDRFHK